MDLVGLLLAAVAACTGAYDAVAWTSRLAMLDDARSAAYVRADPSLLDDVYVADSAVRRLDTRAIRAYEARGLEVDAVRLDLLRLVVESRTDARVVLRVVDQLAPVKVRYQGGRWRTLPRDQPTERRITVVDTVAGWRIADVERLAG